MVSEKSLKKDTLKDLPEDENVTIFNLFTNV